LSFTLLLFHRMIHTIASRSSITTIPSLSHSSLIYVLTLETILPLASFAIPAIGLILGLTLSQSDPSANCLSLLFFSSHALFVSLVTLLFYLRFHQTPNQFISTKVTPFPPSPPLPSLLKIVHLLDDTTLPSLITVP
ncbi:hypothetical protein PENTCL1PPCAC_18184, partial [Pristionchus entomophagus]